MKILSIDTSSKICATSVIEIDENKNIKVLKEESRDNGLTHSQTLMPIIKEMLETINIKLENIDLIVCDKGPGSFTGIRIGVATAKAFSDALNIKTIGISSLEALAYNVKNNGIICSLIDANNENVYWSVFEKQNEKYILKQEFQTNEIFKVIEEVKKCNEEITFVGDGSINYKDMILGEIPNAKFEENNYLSAVNLAIAGINHYEEDRELEELLPLYIKKPQAERELEKKEMK